MAYCEVTDLLTGNIPVPRALDVGKVVQDAADEIDAALGQVYVTPIVFPDLATNPAVRPSALALKSINAKLASGRLIMAADAGGQDTQLHAYGLSLLKEARASLVELRTSSETLPGATPIPNDGLVTQKAPTILNQDPVSMVDFFYDSMNPLIGRQT